MESKDLDQDLLPQFGMQGPVGSAATTNQRLSYTIQELRNLQKILPSELLKTRISIQKLQKAITEANEKNDKLQRLFLILTIIGVIFAASGIIQAWDILVRGIGK